MKILYLSGALGSLGNHDVRLLRSLIERGHCPILVSYHPEEPSEDVKQLKGLTIIHKKPTWFKRVQRIFYWNRVGDLRGVIFEQNPDIMISINTWNNTYLGAMSGFHPHISIPKGSDIMLFPQKYFFVRYLNRKALWGADVIAPDCLTVKEMIIRDYGIPEDKFMIFYWGIDTRLFKPKSDMNRIRTRLGWKDNKIIIMNRHFENVYGINYFIDVLPHVIKIIPEVRVFLIGDGSLKGKILKQIVENKLEKFIHFPGRVTLFEMAEYLQNADLYVSSSLSDGTSVSLLEAMSCALPVVCTDVPAILEWISDGDNGLVVRRRNVRQLSAAIIKLLSDKQTAEHMGKQNRMLAEQKADWNMTVSHLEKVCYKLLKKNMNPTNDGEKKPFSIISRG